MFLKQQRHADTEKMIGFHQTMQAMGDDKAMLDDEIGRLEKMWQGKLESMRKLYDRQKQDILNVSHLSPEVEGQRDKGFVSKLLRDLGVAHKNELEDFRKFIEDQRKEAIKIYRKHTLDSYGPSGDRRVGGPEEEQIDEVERELWFPRLSTADFATAIECGTEVKGRLEGLDAEGLVKVVQNSSKIIILFTEILFYTEVLSKLTDIIISHSLICNLNLNVISRISRYSQRETQASKSQIEIKMEEIPRSQKELQWPPMPDPVSGVVYPGVCLGAGYRRPVTAGCRAIR
jgi:hypothetical protein